MQSRLGARVLLVGAVAVAVFLFVRELDASSAASVCRSGVAVRVLPTWARTGFSDPNPRMPYVLGKGGQIAGIVFGHPLTSPPRKDRNNKILWVSHASTKPGSDLLIRAQRMTGSGAVGSPVTRRVIGGPGPSIIDLPSAGCWRLTLRWSGQRDTLDVRYANGR